MQVSSAGEAARSGMTANIALEAAADFAYLGGEHPVSIGGKEKRLLRVPGYPFHHEHGDTFFLVWRDRTAVVPGLENIAAGVGWLGMGSPEPMHSFHAFNVTQIFNALCGALHLHPLEQLDLAYAERELPQ